VHRLVRISPFDQNHRRHTSFALVEVMPELESADEAAVVINPQDLRIDTYRSTGAGGQHVNETDSAIRNTHLPTGIVVTCQNERSQMKNREMAMKVLKARLFQRQQQEAAAQLDQIRGQILPAEFGSQIRNYVLQPYTLVKDVRTGLEVGNAQSVLDGDVDPFIESWLRWRLSQGGDRDLELDGLAVEAFPVETDTAMFDLTLLLSEHDDVLVGWLEYATDLYDRSSAERLARHFGNLLEAIVADPRAPIGALELLDDAVQRGQPRSEQVGVVAGPEEALAALVHVVDVVVPADAHAATDHQNVGSGRSVPEGIVNGGRIVADPRKDHRLNACRHQRRGHGHDGHPRHAGASPRTPRRARGGGREPPPPQPSRTL